MALIKCPECGKEVSSNANQCIHCGCKFTVCPECGNITVGEVSICQQCGYSFKKNATVNKPAEEDNSKLEGDLLKQWQNASPVDKTLMKVSKVVKIAVGILSFVFLIIAAIKIITWSKSDELEQLLTFNKTTNTIKSMIALACIFDITDILCEPIINAFIKLRCSKWISKSKFDGIGYLRNHINIINENNDLDEYKLLTDAVYYSKNRNNQYEIYVGIIVRLLCAVALFTCVGICIMQNLTELMNAKLYNRSFEFQYIALIFCGIFAIVYLIAVVAVDSLNGKKFDAWLEKNITGDFDE